MTLTPFAERCMELLRQREQATTPEGKAEAERLLADLIRENARKGRADVKQRQTGEV